jgi:aspartate racemase
MKTKNQTMIGVVGGMGPYAGLDLVRKIFYETNAKTDQDHIPIAMISVPHIIEDRTEFIVGNTDVNPGIAISKVIHKLVDQGATVIGMPCNTAHADPIFNEILNHIPSKIKLIHMIREVAQYIKNEYPSFKKIGVLSTAGTSISNVYQNALGRYGLTELKVSSEIQNSTIDPAIYSKTYGVKAFSNPISEQAKNDLSSGIDHLINNGAEAVILGCTEIPLAVTEQNVNGVPIIDSTKVLARALISASSPHSLLPENDTKN